MSKQPSTTRKVSTIADVAGRAGVTATTVSMVMRNKPGISAPTRDRVLKVARELDYRPSATRQTRGAALCGQVGLLLVSELPPRIDGDIGGSYLHDLLNGCLVEAESKGNSLNVSRMTFAQVRAGQLPQSVARQHLDGLIIRGWAMPEFEDLLGNLKLPVVYVDCNRHLGHATQIQIENLQAMDLLTSHLIEIGAKRIATITGDMDHLNAQERLAGLRMALERREMSLLPQLLVMEKGFDEESGARGVETLLSRGETFDTLVCQNDLIALGAMRALSKRGLSVPHDVRVTGFDNMSFSRNLAVPLTTVDPQPYRLGQLATRLLLERVIGVGRAFANMDERKSQLLSVENTLSETEEISSENEAESNHGTGIQVRVPAKLIVRASTQPNLEDVASSDSIDSPSKMKLRVGV